MRVDDLQDPLHPGPCLLPDGHQGGELANGGDELAQIGGEGEERAQREVAIEREPAAKQQHADLTQCGNGLQSRGILGLQPHDAHPVREQPGGFGLELPQLPLFLAEPLHDAHAGDRCFNVSHDLAGLLLGRPVCREQIASGRRRDVPQRGGHGEGHQGQRGREKQHDHKRHHEQQRGVLERIGRPNPQSKSTRSKT